MILILLTVSIKNDFRINRIKVKHISILLYILYIDYAAQNIFTAFKANPCVCNNFLDLTKAFDKFWHKGLLVFYINKLKNSGLKVKPF